MFLQPGITVLCNKTIYCSNNMSLTFNKLRTSFPPTPPKYNSVTAAEDDYSRFI